MSLPSTTQPYHPHTVSRTSPVLSVNGQTGNAAIKYLANVPSGDTAESDAWRLQATKGDIFSNMWGFLSLYNLQKLIQSKNYLSQRLILLMGQSQLFVMLSMVGIQQVSLVTHECFYKNKKGYFRFMGTK